MTDFTHHTPKLLTEADAAADLAGLPRPSEAPQALPRPVSTDEACVTAERLTLRVHTLEDIDTAALMLWALVSERDALAVRVRRLESVVSDFLDYVEEPPDRNCSCHISPPCNDCVDHSGAREAFDRARAALTTPESKP